ncbi:MAG TPA: hypothetical protein VF629_17605 [Hymenobacter sp.]|jgi:hypothetical protein|uniref:hypothetical protein n=1 Tax=Hymenobacter sp. TaxID=1898978 RepID=UPI002EDAE55E
MSQEFEKPSGSLGGMLSSLFRGGSMPSMPGGSNTTRNVLGGALLAAGAAYLYNRSKGRNLPGVVK